MPGRAEHLSALPKDEQAVLEAAFFPHVRQADNDNAGKFATHAAASLRLHQYLVAAYSHPVFYES